MLTDGQQERGKREIWLIDLGIEPSLRYHSPFLSESFPLSTGRPVRELG